MTERLCDVRFCNGSFIVKQFRDIEYGFPCKLNFSLHVSLIYNLGDENSIVNAKKCVVKMCKQNFNAMQ